MTIPTTSPPPIEWPKRLLTSMRTEGAGRVWRWTLPAWAGRLPDGRTYNACPSAGVCADLCYARAGTYRFSNVLAAHERNLRMILDEPVEWEQRMTAELSHKRFDGAHVRVHDAGDFFTREYLAAWLRIMRASPKTSFYAYTKEIRAFLDDVVPAPPANFRWVFSYGGTQDALIDEKVHRHADVFPDEEAVADAGYFSQTESDLLAVYGPARVGIPANNLRHLQRRQGRSTFRALQARADRDRAERRARRTGPGRQRKT